MELSHLSIENYRGIRELDFPLSRFACLIGRNNAGKSTVLQAVALFFSGTKLTKADYFDESLPIRIAIQFSKISDVDIGRLSPEHQTRISELVVDGKLTLVRHYQTDGKSRLRYSGRIPIDPRFHDDTVGPLLKGKKGGPLVVAVESIFPELKGKVNSTTTITKAKELIGELGQAIPDAEKTVSDSDLPTGIDESVRAFLPEPIYIPAVKNLADDTKTSQATPFGRILGILLEAVEPKLENIAALFSDLTQKFNRTVNSDGSVSDNRLDEVKLIESTVEQFVRESFAGVSLEIKIPPPELRALLSSAQIMVDDGVYGPIDSKGDGLRRAVVFAVLRSYVALTEPDVIAGAPLGTASDRHLLLFEEPEIYLHPAAQHTLFDALRVFAVRNHVIITTHSPSFFGPESTDNFVRLAKKREPAVCPKPYTVATRIDMSDVREKDLFQLICFENNNAAFFFDTVILVEGDSDYIVWPHLLSLLDSNWRTARANARLTRIGGKASVRRYREFFRRFGVRVATITDLDILTKDFEQLDAGEDIGKLRDDLLTLVDTEVEARGGFSKPRPKDVKKLLDSGDAYSLWMRARTAYGELSSDASKLADVVATVEAFFAWEKRRGRLEVLRDHSNARILAAKRELLAKLREHDVFVLEKGELEDYYPDDIDGHDKPTKAQSFCKQIATKQAAMSLCEYQLVGESNHAEFELICRGLLSASGC